MGLTRQYDEAIFGEAFAPEITKQIEVRQKLEAKGLATTLEPDIIKYRHASTAWIKMVSSVDVTAGSRFTGTRLEANAKWGPGKTSLATRYVLFGGQSGTNGNIRGGLSFTDTNSSYHRTDEFGFRPMPGITSINVSHVDNGTLVKSTVKLKVYSAEDMEAIDNLYLRLGYTMLLEWGHAIYATNKEEIVEVNSQNTYSLESKFLEGKATWKSILEELRTRRKTSNGNYDGLIGKVVNFSWNFAEDGSYDVTIDLFSLGSIIESLNLSSGAITPPQTLQTALEQEGGSENYNRLIVESFTSTLGGFLGNFAYVAANSNHDSFSINFSGSVTTPTPVNLSTGYPKLKADERSGTDSTTAVAVKYKIPGGPGGDYQYYIRFGDLLQFLEKYYILQNGDSDGPITTINYHKDSCITYAPGIPVVSADPTICMVRNRLTDPETVKPPKVGTIAEVFKVQGAGGVVPPQYQTAITDIPGTGYAMHIYLNMIFVLDSFKACVDETKESKVPLQALLEKICAGINSALGHSCQLKPFYNDYNNVYKIINKKVFNNLEKFAKAYDGANTTKALFLIYGYGKVGNNIDGGTFVRKLSLQTKLDKDVGSTIAAGAAVQGIAPGVDATAFTKWSEGLTDRIIPNKTGPLTPSTEDETQKKEQEKREQDTLDNWSKYVVNLINLEQNAASVPSPTPTAGQTFTWSPTMMDSAKATYTEYIRYTAGLEAREDLKDKKASYLFGWLPLDIQLTVKGISGIKVLQTFNIDSRVLPANYPSNLETIVAGLTHEVNADGWTTTIRTFATFKSAATRRNAKGSSGIIGKENVKIQPQPTGQPIGTCPTLKEVTPVPTPTLTLPTSTRLVAMKNTVATTKTLLKLPKPGLCALGTYNIALLFQAYAKNNKKAIDSWKANATKKTFTASGGSANGDANNLGLPGGALYHANLRALGYTSEEVLVGGSKSKIQSILNKTTFNIGDIVVYWCSVIDAPEDKRNPYIYGHTQIYRGSGTGGTTPWQSDIFNQSAFVYGSVNSNCWNLTIFRTSV